MADSAHARRLKGLTQATIVGLIVAVLALTVVAVYLSQQLAERGSFAPPRTGTDLGRQREVEKLTAEIRQIRSETAGSLFWLKLIGVFVTVGSAVGGYLLAQSRTTRQRLDFEHRKDVDGAYGAIVQELASGSALLRAAAAVKLGSLLDSFPAEWKVGLQRKKELIALTKQVLATALCIETEAKVRKALTIALPLHHPWRDQDESNKRQFGDLRRVDLSNVKADDAYWASIDFSGADFYRTELRSASLRNSILRNAQFRDAFLGGAVLCGADCSGANFKHADLRGANLDAIANWREIGSMELANIHGVVSPPEGFLGWATGQGSVSIESDTEWAEALASPKLAK